MKVGITLGINLLNIEKKGHVRLRVLLNLMECMDFQVPLEDSERIKSQFTVDSANIGPKTLVRYREVVKALHIN